MCRSLWLRRGVWVGVRGTRVQTGMSPMAVMEEKRVSEGERVSVSDNENASERE